jgi:hypothetical protein
MTVQQGLYFGLAVLVSGFVCYQVYELRQDIRSSTAAARDNIPAILDNSNKIAQAAQENIPTLLENSNRIAKSVVKLTDDLAALRELVAPSTGPGSDVTPPMLATFASGLLDTIEKSGGEIGSKGSPYRKATEWVVGERKEALWLSFRVKSKAEMLDKICKTIFGNPWMIRFGKDHPVPLREWLLKQRPELAELDKGKG